MLRIRDVDAGYGATFGEKIAEGVPDEIRNDPKVIEAYLGPPEEDW